MASSWIENLTDKDKVWLKTKLLIAKYAQPHYYRLRQVGPCHQLAWRLPKQQQQHQLSSPLSKLGQKLRVSSMKKPQQWSHDEISCKNFAETIYNQKLPKIIVNNQFHNFILLNDAELLFSNESEIFVHMEVCCERGVLY